MTLRSRPTGFSVTFTPEWQARFHNGAPVLAADVLHSLQLTNKLAAPQYRTIYAQVKGVA
jgi:microcin C transport system substrate-binding protein